MRGLLLVALLVTSGCEDLRTFDGVWSGPRVGGAEVNRGFESTASASLAIDDVGLDSLRARLTTSDGLLDEATIEAIPEAEADALAGLTFWGSPLRVFLSFAPASDGAGDVLAIVSLFADDRVEVRLLRGGQGPRYGVFSLQPQ